MSIPGSNRPGQQIFDHIIRSRNLLSKSPIFAWCPFLVLNTGPLSRFHSLFMAANRSAQTPAWIPLFVSHTRTIMWYLVSPLIRPMRGTIRWGCSTSNLPMSRYFNSPARSIFTVSSPLRPQQYPATKNKAISTITARPSQLVKPSHSSFSALRSSNMISGVTAKSNLAMSFILVWSLRLKC
jgi:hypothetical protein